MSRILDNAKKGESEPEDFENEVYRLDEEPDKSSDIQLIAIMPDLLKHYEDQSDLYTYELSWRWHWTNITSGVYPLEKLPEHVRDIAKALYYNKKQGAA